jgi:hypothetical protein
LEALFDGVDDLIRRVAEESPEIRKIRARVRANMVAAKSAIDDGVSDSGAHRVRERPGQSLGWGLAMAFGLSFVALLET